MDGRPPEVGNDERLSARPPVWPPKQNAGSSGTGVFPGRGGGIRTHDLFVPNEARYQAAPHPVATPPSLADVWSGLCVASVPDGWGWWKPPVNGSGGRHQVQE